MSAKKSKSIVAPVVSYLTMADLENTPVRLNERNFTAQVQIAQPLVGTHLHGQIEIAMCAMKACEVLEHRRKKYKTEFTPKKFAESIGLEPKTLYEWMAIARNVVMRLPPNTYKPEQFSVAYRAHRKVTLDDSDATVKQVFEEEAKKGPYAYYLESLIKNNRTGFRFLRKRISELPERELRHLRIYCRHMTLLLDEHLGAPTEPEEMPEKEQTNRTTNAFNYTRRKSYDGDNLHGRKGRTATANQGET